MGYTVVEGLRCVKPYIFVFRCGAKGRWFKRAILDVSGLCRIEVAAPNNATSVSSERSQVSSSISNDVWLYAPDWHVQVFLEEFGAYPPGYYRESIRIGTILVNDEKVEPTYLLRNGDKVIHKTHRHEPPVTAKEVSEAALSRRASEIARDSATKKNRL